MQYKPDNIIHDSSRGSRGMSAPQGMSAHLIIRGSASCLVLKLGHKVAHNPNFELLILSFASSGIQQIKSYV